MCGIIAGTNFKGKSAAPINEFIINQFEDQHARGTQGFGAIFVAPDGSYKIRRACEPAKAIVDLYGEPASTIIFHHRMPTSTHNKLSQTHPIVVDNGNLKHKYLVIHNGICYNSHEMKQQHEELGFIYTTQLKDGISDKAYKSQDFNDSESVAIELARFAEKQTDQIASEGYAAVIAVRINKKTDKADKILFYRTQTADLNMSLKKNQLLLSSEGEGEEIKDAKLYSWDIKTNKLITRDIVFYQKPVTVIQSTNLNNHGWRPTNHGYNYNEYGKKLTQPNFNQPKDEADLFTGPPDIDLAREGFEAEVEDILEEVRIEIASKEGANSLSCKDYKRRFMAAIGALKKEACMWHALPEDKRIPSLTEDTDTLLGIGFNPHSEESVKVESNQPKNQGVPNYDQPKLLSDPDGNPDNGI